MAGRDLFGFVKRSLPLPFKGIVTQSVCLLTVNIRSWFQKQISQISQISKTVKEKIMESLFFFPPGPSLPSSPLQSSPIFQILACSSRDIFCKIEQVCKWKSFWSPLLRFPPSLTQMVAVAGGFYGNGFWDGDLLAGSLLGSALRANICEGEREAGLTRGRNSNYHVVTREASASPTGALEPEDPSKWPRFRVKGAGLWLVIVSGHHFWRRSSLHPWATPGERLGVPPTLLAAGESGWAQHSSIWRTLLCFFHFKSRSWRLFHISTIMLSLFHL